MEQARRVGRLTAVLATAVLLMGACAGGDAAGGDDGGAAGSGSRVLADSDCRRYVEAFRRSPQVSDPTSVEAMTEVADVLDEAADGVPNQVSEDFRTVAGAYREFADAMGSLDLDFSDPGSMASLSSEDLAGLQAASQVMSSEEVRQAVGNIDTFLDENCS